MWHANYKQCEWQERVGLVDETELWKEWEEIRQDEAMAIKVRKG